MKYSPAFARGAGTSKGRTSWAGKGELADYISFAGFFAHYLSMLDNPAYVTSLSEVQSSPVYLMPESATRRAFPQQDRSLVPTPEQLQLILGGYSYGSFVVTHLPAVNEILGRFSLPKEGTAEAEILLRARSLATQSNTELESFDRRSKWSRDTPSKRSHSVTIGGEESSPEVRRASREARRSGEGKLSFDIPRKIKSLRSRSVPASTNDTQSSLSDTMASAVSVSYLLISPLLPPISSALAPSLVFSASTTRSKEQRQLVEHPTLAVFGDKDGFTSVKKLRTWAQQLATQCDSRFQFEEIADAGHFWHEQDVQAELKEVVSRWAADITRMSAEA